MHYGNISYFQSAYPWNMNGDVYYLPSNQGGFWDRYSVEENYHRNYTGTIDEVYVITSTNPTKRICLSITFDGYDYWDDMVLIYEGENQYGPIPVCMIEWNDTWNGIYISNSSFVMVRLIKSNPDDFFPDNTLKHGLNFNYWLVD
jgi:hypothetical protein